MGVFFSQGPYVTFGIFILTFQVVMNNTRSIFIKASFYSGILMKENTLFLL
jgi:hypothetical protein